MLTVPFGFECNDLNGNGANLGVIVNRPITILGIQVDCSVMSIGSQVGNAQVLFDCVMYPGANIQGPPPSLYLGDNPNSDFSFNPSQNIADGGCQAHGNCGGQGRLFAAIVKIWSPSAAGRVICLNGLNISVPAGGQILFHIDHAGIPVDGEMQGVFFYQ